MTEIMTLNYLFFLGILIPCIITIALFIVFIVCWWKYKIRRDIMTKKHDPHGKLRKIHGVYAPPPPPLPPFPNRWRHECLKSDNAGIEMDNAAYDESTDCSPSQPNSQIYNTFHDSGMSELSEGQYKCECDRPYSQASTDSEDSGFRSSRSGQYLHSAQNSNAQETPLFKPIKSHKESITQHGKNVHSTHSCQISNGEFMKNSSRHSRHIHRPPSCRKSTEPSPSSSHCNPSPFMIKDSSPVYHTHNNMMQQPSPLCFTNNPPPSFMKFDPLPFHRRNSPEDLDLQQIETDVKLSHISTVSQQCRPLTVTTATVHRPICHADDMGQQTSYSVV